LRNALNSLNAGVDSSSFFLKIYFFIMIKRELHRFVEGRLVDIPRRASVFEIVTLNVLSLSNVLNFTHTS